MKPHNKIFFAFVLVALLNLLPSLFRVNGMEHVRGDLNVIIKSNLDEQEGISQLAYYLQRAKSNTRELLLEVSNRPNNKEVENAKNAISESITRLQSNFILLNKGTLKGRDMEGDRENKASYEEIKMVYEISKNLRDFIENTNEIMKVADNQDEYNFYLAIFVTTVEPISRVLQKQIEDFKIEEFEEVERELQEVEGRVANMQNKLTILSVISFALSLIVAFLFARNVAQSKRYRY